MEVTPLDGDGRLPLARGVPVLVRRPLRARDHCLRVSGKSAGAPDAPYRFLNDPVHQFLLRIRQDLVPRHGASATSGAWRSTSRSPPRPASSSRTRRASPTASSPSRSPTPPASPRCCRARRCPRPQLLRRVLAAHPRARSRRARGPQHLPLRPRVPRGAGAAAPRAARVGARRRPCCAAIPSRMQVAERSDRLPALRGRPAATSWTPGSWPSSTTWARATCESYGLKDMARHFGVAAPDRTYLPPEDIPRIFRRGPGAAHGLRARRRAGDARDLGASCRRPTSCRRRPCRSTTRPPCCAATRPRSTRC